MMFIWEKLGDNGDISTANTLLETTVHVAAGCAMIFND
jgi:hypothetical protein